MASEPPPSPPPPSLDHAPKIAPRLVAINVCAVVEFEVGSLCSASQIYPGVVTSLISCRRFCTSLARRRGR